MLIIAVDDDRDALVRIRNELTDAAPEAQVKTFSTIEEARKALNDETTSKEACGGKLEVKCFGYFDVLWQGRPLIFKRKQSKELLAYLIDRGGAACSSEEIAASLWGDYDSDAKAEKNRLRVLISDLKGTLKDIGMEDALVREKREVAILRDHMDCDYYRLLSGDKTAFEMYDGEYMKQYEWAELTNARLHFMTEEKSTLHDTSILYV